jgi:hypothetical protein
MVLAIVGLRWCPCERSSRCFQRWGTAEPRPVKPSLDIGASSTSIGCCATMASSSATRRSDLRRRCLERLHPGRAAARRRPPGSWGFGFTYPSGKTCQEPRSAPAGAASAARSELASTSQTLRASARIGPLLAGHLPSTQGNDDRRDINGERHRARTGGEKRRENRLTGIEQSRTPSRSDSGGVTGPTRPSPTTGGRLGAEATERLRAEAPSISRVR